MKLLKLCACGCGEYAKPGRTFLKGHHSRLPKIRKKLSIANTGKRHSKEAKRKNAEWHQGRKLSKESIKKRTKSRKGYKHSSETKSRIKQSVEVSWQNPDHRLRVVNSVKESWKTSRDCRSGENHPNWQGGISAEPYGIEFNNNLKEKIRERDGRRCQYCNLDEKENGKKLDVHHIDYNKKNSKERNLISLCFDCHRKTNFNRDYWERYYKKFAVERVINFYLMNIKLAEAI